MTSEKEKNLQEYKFKGKYIKAVGRRKNAIAQIRLYRKGEGIMMVNDRPARDYFSADGLTLLRQPLKLTSHLKDLDFSIVVKGGGKKGQAEAIRHGLSRSLIEFDKELAPQIRTKGWLSRDARKKERKKPGLKKARRAPQWSKR